MRLKCVERNDSNKPLVKVIMKIFLGEFGTTQVEVTENTLVEEICVKINEKYKTMKDDKKQLFLSLHDPKKVKLESQLLRLLRPNERLLELSQILAVRKIEHRFYALPNLPLERQEENKHIETPSDFLKNSTIIVLLFI